MKKVERLNQMLRFINQKQIFTLKDLMDEFQISKRTALRDIASLEEMGVPSFCRVWSVWRVSFNKNDDITTDFIYKS